MLIIEIPKITPDSICKNCNQNCNVEFVNHKYTNFCILHNLCTLHCKNCKETWFVYHKIISIHNTVMLALAHKNDLTLEEIKFMQEFIKHDPVFAKTLEYTFEV